MATSIQKFFRRNPIFTSKHFVESMEAQKKRSSNTYKAMLAHHLKQGHIIRIRRGLFATIPIGAEPNAYPINPYLIAGFLAEDSIIAYHTALAFHKINYTISFRFLYLTQYRSPPIYFRSELYQSVKFPTALKIKSQEQVFINREEIQGMEVKVTSLERTVVDNLDKLNLGGGLEEVWRSLEMITHLKIDQVIEYALSLRKETTVAKVGFYLEQYKQTLGVAQSSLNLLRHHCPKTPHYIGDRTRHKNKVISNWNIIVPVQLLNREWEEDLDINFL